MYPQDQILMWFDSIQLVNGQKFKEQSYQDGDFPSEQGLSEIKSFSLVGQMFKPSNVGDGMRMRLWRKSTLLRSQPSVLTLVGERRVFRTRLRTWESELRRMNVAKMNFAFFKSSLTFDREKLFRFKGIKVNSWAKVERHETNWTVIRIKLAYPGQQSPFA